MKLNFKKLLTYTLSAAVILGLNACGVGSSTPSNTSTALTTTSTNTDPYAVPPTSLNDILTTNTTTPNQFQLPASQPTVASTPSTAVLACSSSPSMFYNPSSFINYNTTNSGTCATGQSADALWATLGNGLAVADACIQMVLGSIPADASASQLNQLKTLFIGAIAKCALRSAQYTNSYAGYNTFGNGVGYQLSQPLNTQTQYTNWSIYNQFFPN